MRPEFSRHKSDGSNEVSVELWIEFTVPYVILESPTAYGDF